MENAKMNKEEIGRKREKAEIVKIRGVPSGRLPLRRVA